MASAGVGFAVLEVVRMERALARRESFARRVFSEEERAVCEAAPRPAEHYAARLAARAAVCKALELGPEAGVRRHDVHVTQGTDGRPQAKLAGVVAEAARARGVTEIALSLSYTHEVATAMALLVTEEVKPKQVKERDPERELRASFRQARTVLDELDRLQA